MHDVICVAEGFATAASIHNSTGYPTAVAFNAGNMVPVSKKIRSQYPRAKLIICADDDHTLQNNPGLTQATSAAMAVGGLLAVPDFGSDRPEGATDFNDLAELRGRDVVKSIILSAAEPIHKPIVEQTSNDACVATVACVADPVWSEPAPLTVTLKPDPYPVDALPPTIQAAVKEAFDFVKAPVPLVASSAISALSLTIQPYVNVERAKNLVGPVSLFIMTVADSGERKTTCDNLFSKVIRDHEYAKRQQAQPLLEQYKAEHEVWEAKRNGVKEKIRKNAAMGKPTVDLERILFGLEADKPKKIKVLRLIYGDVTPESLAYNLATNWPSAGVVSAEAGVVFGAHGMSSDSAMKNLSQLNILWDGGSLSVDRRTTESFMVHGARLTMSLQVQESTLKSFFDRTGSLARGTGFLARFLFAMPDSNQGNRFFEEAPSNWPALDAFNSRISALLDAPYPVDENGILTPSLMTLSPETKTAWVKFYNEVEAQLGEGGQLRDVRDVSSKAADNAVRLAALFQVFERGFSGTIDLESFESASRIVAWHLSESRRFYGDAALPSDLKNAAKLDHWLLSVCSREKILSVPTRRVLQSGPSGLRNKAILEMALAELQELGRLRITVDGKHRNIEVNPKLLENDQGS